MKEEKNILNDLKRKGTPKVPEGFFDQFFDNLLLRIEEEESILGQLKKAPKPNLPNGYFEQDFDFITDSDSFELDDLKKAPKPEVTPDFFSKNEASIVKAVLDQESSSNKKGKIIPLRWIGIAASIAAVVAIIITAVNFNDPIQNETVLAEKKALDVDDYLTYLDESEIIEYIIENDISVVDDSEELTDEEYDIYMDFSEQDIEDYYLDL